MVALCNLVRDALLTDIAVHDPDYDGTLLGRFGGARPPAAAWFKATLAHEPDRSFFEVEGARIELLTWGEVGRPGLLFLHGNAAHADWWSFIAPQFAADYRCAAISWSGMGRSDWREAYSIPLFAREVLAAIDAAGLAHSGAPPVIVAHSFGGFPTLHVASFHPNAIAGAILVDSAPPPRRRGAAATPCARPDPQPALPLARSGIAQIPFSSRAGSRSAGDRRLDRARGPA
jgi:pimeloyl-ACP methyl ester carboxylesterase